ncbi:MAG: aminotransferase class I/II-fold pyridoxal phosphate-dependent enzyme [Firmicutes bacterium]|nr:aminotransferase class I/II-fold pyridoxal phosphate-dependent enzyme [Bacillota bacterium]
MEHRFIANKYWEETENVFGTIAEKIKDIDDCINLSIGDPDLTTDPAITEAAFKDALNGHTKYTHIRGYVELRDEIRKFYEEEYNMNVKDEEVIVMASGLFGMYMTLQAVLNPGDEVLVLTPSFSSYFGQVKMAGGVPIQVPTYEEEDFQINIERLEKFVTPKTKVLIVNSPSNPTGNCLSKQTMEGIAKFAMQYDLLVIADDIYTSFSFQNKFEPIASIPGMKERTVIINSFSKNYLMTGWRIGAVIGPEYIVRVIAEINECVVFSAPAVSQRAALYAIRNRRTIQPPIIEEYKKRMEYAAKRINQVPWMKVIEPPKGSFYLFINVKELGLTSTEVCNMLLEKAHVLFLPGNLFGDCGEGYIRMACTVGVDKIKEAFDRIEKIKK